MGMALRHNEEFMQQSKANMTRLSDTTPRAEKPKATKAKQDSKGAKTPKT